MKTKTELIREAIENLHQARIKIALAIMTLNHIKIPSMVAFTATEMLAREIEGLARIKEGK